MTTPQVAQDIDSLCRKCGGETRHVIVAMVGGTIAKVMCKQCKGYHKYRPPNSAAAKKRAARKRSSKSRKSSSRRRRSEPRLEPRIEANLDLPIRDYSIRESYTPGERIQHPRFGVGVVETLNSGKMEVFFSGGDGDDALPSRKTLAQGR